MVLSTSRFVFSWMASIQSRPSVWLEISMKKTVMTDLSSHPGAPSSPFSVFPSIPPTLWSTLYWQRSVIYLSSGQLVESSR